MDKLDETLTSAPEFDAQRALARFRSNATARGIVPRAGWTDALIARISLAQTTWLRAASVAAAVVLVATALAMTGIAGTFLTVFEPKQVATIRIDPRDMSGVPDPTEYGTLTWITRPQWKSAADAAAAATSAGFAPLVPSSLPAGVPTKATFAVTGEGKATFQFDEAKARAAAAKVGAAAAPMPAAIAATTLTMSGGPAIVQQYGGTASTPTDPTSFAGSPPLVIVQAKAPVVTSNGATVDELRDYALKQPGIPPAVAAQIRAIGDPIRTLMIPIGIDLQDAKAVTVRGTQGYLVGDRTGLGSAVVWLENGYVIGVLASVSDTDLIALVNSLR